MPKIYLLGGENVFKRSAKEINEIAFRESKESLQVLVLPWARASFDQKYRKRKLLFDYLLSFGVQNVSFLDYSETQETIAKKIADSNVIYLTGGQPSVLIERLKNKSIDRFLENYQGIIVGRSAGALALCKRCITTCRSNSKVRIVNGLNLLDITLKVHYIPDDDSSLRQLSMKEKIFAVPEGAALIYDDRKLSAIGRTHIFSNGERQEFS